MALTVIASGTRTAKKEHACAWCVERIQPREQYVFSDLVDRPDPPYTWKLHEECRAAEARAAGDHVMNDEYVCYAVDVDGGSHLRGKNCTECAR
jgi:hypothetical protein